VDRVNRLTAQAVIPVERDDRGGRIELLREIENVANFGGAAAGRIPPASQIY